MYSSEFRRRILGQSGKQFDQLASLYRLKWLGHILHIPNHRLSRYAMLVDVRVGWRKAKCGYIYIYINVIVSSVSSTSKV